MPGETDFADKAAMEQRTGNLELIQQTLHYTLDIISDGVWDWDANTGYVYRSPGWYRMLGYEVDSLENTVFTWESVIHPDDYERVMAHFNAYISHQSDSYQIEYRCRMHSGDYLWIEDRGRVVLWNEDGTVGRMIGAHRNIHLQKLAQLALELKNQQLEQQVEARTRELRNANLALEDKILEVEALAEKDPLTGAYNRHRFDRTLRSEITRAQRHGSSLSLIIFDLDHFKEVNDSYGHTVGDKVLVKLTELVSRNIRGNDLMARWGGEEFMIVAPNDDLAAAASMAEKLRQLAADSKVLEDRAVTCSFGVAEYRHGDDVGSLIKRADQALYRAKSGGRNRVELAD